jgi:hypothetical protein
MTSVVYVYNICSVCLHRSNLFLDIARQCISTKTITVRDYDKPWLNNEIRKEIRLRDRMRKNVRKFGRESDTLKYKKKQGTMSII